MAESEPIFLARQSFHRRRIADAAKLVPVLGVVLMLIPILWDEGYASSGAMVYVFSVWAILILLIGLLSSALARSRPESDVTDGSNATEL
ncbi:MAG: hypothetical protein HKN18_10140 [Silicimonas sp.]|nr:hypothetical protein [Silicimonas sp.]